MAIVGRHVEAREAVLISLVHINLGSGGSLLGCRVMGMTVTTRNIIILLINNIP